MKQFSEEELREEAKKRVSFKSHATSYVIVNLFIWIFYFITGSYTSPPWPIWATFGWGVGLVFHYFGVYHMGSIFSVEREMENLRKKDK